MLKFVVIVVLIVVSGVIFGYVVLVEVGVIVYVE